MKEGYIKMRNSKKLNNNWLWEYYKQNGGKINNPQQFIELFYYEITHIDMGGQVFEQRTNRDLSSFWTDMDHKFNLQILYTKDDKFIKVVE